MTQGYLDTLSKPIYALFEKVMPDSIDYLEGLTKEYRFMADKNSLVLVIDNYDSFTYNLVDLVHQFGQKDDCLA